LRSRPTLALGTISYSLYLTHYPALALVHAATGGRSTADGLRLLALGVPASVVMAAGFSMLVERRFLGGRSVPVGSAIADHPSRRPARRWSAIADPTKL